MSLAKVFDKLGESVIPKIAAKVFPDTMNILRDTNASDGGGGQIVTQTTVNLDPIPCSYKPQVKVGFKGEHGDRLMSITLYVVTLPSNQVGALIDILPFDRINVLERGNQPAKMFRVVSLKNNAGVSTEAVCELENET